MSSYIPLYLERAALCVTYVEMTHEINSTSPDLEPLAKMSKITFEHVELQATINRSLGGG